VTNECLAIAAPVARASALSEGFAGLHTRIPILARANVDHVLSLCHLASDPERIFDAELAAGSDGGLSVGWAGEVAGARQYGHRYCCTTNALQELPAGETTSHLSSKGFFDPLCPADLS
jgi:hypothetical protein